MKGEPEKRKAIERASFKGEVGNLVLDMLSLRCMEMSIRQLNIQIQSLGERSGLQMFSGYKCPLKLCRYT